MSAPGSGQGAREPKRGSYQIIYAVLALIVTGHMPVLNANGVRDDDLGNTVARRTYFLISDHHLPS